MKRRLIGAACLAGVLICGCKSSEFDALAKTVLAAIERAIEKRYDTIEATYHDTLGYPTQVSLYDDPSVADGGHGYFGLVLTPEDPAPGREDARLLLDTQRQLWNEKGEPIYRIRMQRECEWLSWVTADHD